MNYFYISGTSKGLGKAIAIELLSNSNNKVIGFSRTQSLNHPNYEHRFVDLSQVDQVEAFQFSQHDDAKKIVLINNSGRLGMVKPIGNSNYHELEQTLTVNTLAPIILMDKFVAQYQKVSSKKVIVNISSGAGRHPFPSWGMYCASKSALDMYSQVLFTEQNLKSENEKIFVYSVAPGIIDTEMQDEIRAVNPDDFLLHNIFVGYKENEQLWSPQKSGSIIKKLWENPENYTDVLQDVRKI